MTMHAENGLVRVRGVLDDVFDQFPVLGRLRVAHGVGHVDGGSPGVDDLGEDADEEVGIGTGGVLGGEFNVGGVLGGLPHSGDGHFHDLIRGFAEFVLHVDGRSGEEDVDARVARALQGLPCAVDVVFVAAGEGRNLHVGYGVGDGVHGLEITHAGRREARFDDVDAEAFELTRHAQLFLQVHGGAGGLFAVAEGRVENNDAVGHGFLLQALHRETDHRRPVPRPRRHRHNCAILFPFYKTRCSICEGRDREPL